MRYVIARIDEYGREMTYRFYIANSLQLAPQRKYITKTLYDVLYNPVKQDMRNGDEIAADVIRNAGLKFG